MFRSLLFSTGLVMLIGAMALAWEAMDRPVNAVSFKGNIAEEERSRIQDAMRQVKLAGILSTDLRDVEKQLEDLGWARRVDVRRRWPDRLEVTVHKEIPVAKWGQGVYLAADGGVLNLPGQYGDLPILIASLSSPRQSMEIYRLLQQFAARQSLSIRTLQESTQGEWSIQFDTGLTLMLGADQITPRMQRFLTAKENIFDMQPRVAAYVDARYPSGLAVRYQDQEILQLVGRQSDVRRYKGL